MKRKIMEKWVAALESGEYLKGTSRLKTIRKRKAPQYCCLGVLCDVYIKEHPKATWRDEDIVGTFLHKKTEEQETAFLPHSVRVWSGISTESAEFVYDGTSIYDDTTSLAGLNDEEFGRARNFNGIVKKIKEVWKVL